MKRPRLVLVLVSLGVLLYLTFLKRHYDSHDALPLRPAPGPALDSGHAHITSDWTGQSQRRIQFGIMFDAGSTGTRVHVFQFRLARDQDQSVVPELVDETFKAIKPGLSAFADDPEKCRAGLLDLLDLAKSKVPTQFWNSTPVFLKATAGLRLLPGDKADLLLDQVRALFQESPFLSAADSVSVLDGTDEGISAWTTVNFLLRAFPGAGASRTVGMLDLGGGSTQVTFSPKVQKTLQSSRLDFIRSFRLFNSTYTVYTHSYLGLGLMSARLSVLGGTSSDPSGGAVLLSPCLPQDFFGTWEQDHINYSLRGRKTGSRFESCSLRVQQVLRDRVKRVLEPEQDFYAFSFYYDRAVDIRAIDERSGGVVSVRDYISAAKRVCGGEVLSPDQSPFLCLDLVYVSVLLQELGFNPKKQFKLARTIGDVETSWALGATFHYIQTLRTH